ncbi:MAG: sialidase family protein, partial [Acidimicrobiales bacterium]
RFSCGVSTSLDGGATFGPAQLALPAGAERCYTTSLGFAPDGTLFLVFVTLGGEGNVPTGAWLTRSPDGGLSFGPPRQVLGPERFMVRLAVDPAAAPPRLVLTWVEPRGIGLLRMVAPSPVMAQVSTDGGASFGPAVAVSAPGRERTGAPIPVVGTGGAVHVAYFDYGRDVFDYDNQPGRYEGTFELIVASSLDGGRTFTESVVNAEVAPAEPFLVFTAPVPGLAADPRGPRLYAVWSDRRGGVPAVMLATSTDGGRSWSGARPIDAGGAEALLPQVAVAPQGRLDVAYARVAAGADGLTEVVLTSSADSGATFGPASPLNNPFRRSWLPLGPRPVMGRDLGSALGLASQDSQVFAAWPDTRKGGTDTLRTDIVAATVRIARDGEVRALP